MQKYVITGASGHIGNVLVKKLFDSNEEKEIVLLLLPGECISEFREYGLNIKFGDILDRNYLDREITKDSIVIHLAGIIDISSKNKDLIYQVNVQGTKNVVDACIKNKAKRLIYTSSVHAIPINKHTKIIKEPLRCELIEKNVKGNYAKSKLLATEYVLDKSKVELDAIVLYPSGVIGPSDIRISEMGHTLLDIMNKKLGARVNGSYNFVDVRDVVDAIISACKNGVSGEGYILSGNNITVDELFKDVNYLFRRTTLPFKIAMWFIKMFAKLAEAYYVARGMKPLFTILSLDTLTSNHNFCNDKAVKDLGFRTRPAFRSIKDSVEWFIYHRPDLLKDGIIDGYIGE